VRVFLAKRSIEESSYTTVTSSLVLLTLFDFVVAGSLVLWAAASGQLPGTKVLQRLPSFDFGWALRHPLTALEIVSLILLVLLVLLLWFAEQLGDFWRKLAQGFAILGDWTTYLRRVALWQAADWVLRFTTVFLFLHAFGLPATLHNALLVQVAAALAALLPISPNGIGTEQALVLYLLGGQVAGRTLLAFSVGMRLTTMIVNAALGFTTLLLTFRTVHWTRHVVRETRT